MYEVKVILPVVQSYRRTDRDSLSGLEVRAIITEDYITGVSNRPVVVQKCVSYKESKTGKYWMCTDVRGKTTKYLKSVTTITKIKR